MQLEQQLEQMGLSESQTRVYLAVLQHGVMTPTQVAKAARMHRTNVYPVLDDLVQKELIKGQKRGKRKAYVPNDPQAFVRLTQRRTKAATELLPQLTALHAQSNHKPVIRFYDGWQEVRMIYEQTLTADHVLAFGNPAQLERLEPGFSAKYARQLKRQNIVFEDVVTKQSASTAQQQYKEILKGLYSYTALDMSNEPPADLLIWGDCVALIALHEPVYGTVIEQPQIAQLLRMLFSSK